MKPAAGIKILFDFTRPDACPWFAIDDVVMGGVSRSTMRMGNDRAVFHAAVTHMSGVVEDILKSEGLRKEDISLYILHQANLRIVEAVASRLGVDESRTYNNIERYGNTTAAALPIALSEALDSGRIRPGDLVMLASFGSGFTWAGALMRW